MAPNAIDSISNLALIVSMLGFLAWGVTAIVNWLNPWRFTAAVYAMLAFGASALILEHHLSEEFITTLGTLAMYGVFVVSGWLALWYIERHGWINTRSSLALLSVVAANVVGGAFALAAGELSYDLALRLAALLTFLSGVYLLITLGAAMHRQWTRA